MANRCGADCGCCVSMPSPAPTPAPTPAPSPQPSTAAPSEDPSCAAATDAQVDRCASRGGDCFAANATCDVRGGVWLSNLCGGEGCGCCIRAPTSSPTWARAFDDDGDGPGTATASPVFYVLMICAVTVVAGTSLVAGYFQQKKLRALEATLERKNMVAHRTSEMVASPRMV